MISKAYVAEMAAYSRWQNDAIYEICDRLSDEARKKDRGLFFKSIHATLDHICVVNQALITFVEGRLPNLDAPDQMAWPDWEKLKETRIAQDNLLIEAGRDWSDDWLGQDITMLSPGPNDPKPVPRGMIVAQIFNHQTHHRSQVTSAFHRMGIDYGNTDMPWRPGAGYFAG